MAQYDPQGPTDNESNDRSDAASQRESAAYTPRWMPPTFWDVLVKSQLTASDQPAPRPERVIRVQSAQLWEAIVRSQRPADQGAASDESYATWLPSDRPAGRIGFAGDASGWSREPDAFEPVQSAAEPIEIEASARREDVEWSAPASSNEDWASARSEGLSYDGTISAPPMFAPKRSPVAPAAKKAAKVRTGRRTVAKNRAAKKAAPGVSKAKKAATARANKPAPEAKKQATRKPVARKVVAKKVLARKVTAKKFVPKKLVKKTTPAPRITKAPTRRAA